MTPRNNPVQDRYNPPSTNTVQFEVFKFGELENNELFWLNEDSNGEINVVHRKVSNNQGLQLKTQQIVEINLNTKVYQKT